MSDLPPIDDSPPDEEHPEGPKPPQAVSALDDLLTPAQRAQLHSDLSDIAAARRRGYAMAAGLVLA